MMSVGTASQEIGEPIPQNTPHAVSVTLPTWKSNVGYEMGEDWVVGRMKTGYPRFFINPVIKELASKIKEKYARNGEDCMIFPSYKAAKRCRSFIESKTTEENIKVRVLQLSTSPPSNDFEKSTVIESTFGIVFFPLDEFALAKAYWQHSGEGISSRMGAYLLRELFNTASNKSAHTASKLELQAKKIQARSPSLSKSLKKPSFGENDEADREFNTFIEQKYGRILDLKFADKANIALRRRISGKVDKSKNQIEEMEKAKRGKNLSETDVYLYPTGMAAIFHSFLAISLIWEKPKKSVCFGFPYVDTRNILNKFGLGYYFLGLGDDESLNALEKQLENGEIDIMALFCECPSNPLLKTPNLRKIKKLSEKFNFAVVVDETIGNFLNVHVLPYADIVVSSLTKIFSGDSNVMGGSLVLNPQSPLYERLKHYLDREYENLLWPEDALYLERNSRDFEERSNKVNSNSLAVVDLFQRSPLISSVHYPSISEGSKHYEEIRTPNGGYGGLLSIVFKNPNASVVFYDNLRLYKGPSLGTNFTLVSPYSILAHFAELNEIEKWGVDKDLIRLSIGLENETELLDELSRCLDLASKCTENA